MLLDEIENWDEVEEDDLPEQVVAPPMAGDDERSSLDAPDDEQTAINMPEHSIRAAPPVLKKTVDYQNKADKPIDYQKRTVGPIGGDIPEGQMPTYGLDPRVLQYMERLSGSNNSISKEMNRENWRTNRQQLFGDIAGGIASGAAQMGTTFGQTPDVSGFQKQMQGQKATAEAYRKNALDNLEGERKERGVLDNRVMEYLLRKKDKGSGQYGSRAKWLPTLAKDGKPVWKNEDTGVEHPRDGKAQPPKTGGRFLETTGASGKPAWRWAEPGAEEIPGPPEREKMVRVERFDPYSGQTIVEFVPEKSAGGTAKPPSESAHGRVKDSKTNADIAIDKLKEMKTLYAEHGKHLANPLTVDHAEAQKRFQALRLAYATARERLANPGNMVTLPEIELIQKWGMPFEANSVMRLDKQEVGRLIDGLDMDAKKAANSWHKNYGFDEPYAIQDVKTPPPKGSKSKKPEAAGSGGRPHDMGEGERKSITNGGKTQNWVKRDGKWFLDGGE